MFKRFSWQTLAALGIVLWDFWRPIWKVLEIGLAWIGDFALFAEHGHMLSLIATALAEPPTAALAPIAITVGGLIWWDARRYAGRPESVTAKRWLGQPKTVTGLGIFLTIAVVIWQAWIPTEPGTTDAPSHPAPVALVTTAAPPVALPTAAEPPHTTTATSKADQPVTSLKLLFGEAGQQPVDVVGQNTNWAIKYFPDLRDVGCDTSFPLFPSYNYNQPNTPLSLGGIVSGGIGGLTNNSTCLTRKYETHYRAILTV